MNVNRTFPAAPMSGLLLTALIAAAVAFLVARSTPSAAPTKSQTVYERVFSSGVLRCGYFEEAPFTIVDPNTGKKSGLAVDLTERIAAQLGLKVKWVESINFATVGLDLQNGRYDAVCSSVFNMPRAGTTDYTTPYAYVPVYAYARQERTEFDNRLDRLDWSHVTIAGLDGEGTTAVALKKLPQAKFRVLPQSAQIADMLASVAYRKADLGFAIPTVFRSFDKTNPGLLRQVAADRPFYVFAVSFALKPDEAAFKNALDYMIRAMTVSGELGDLYGKYDPDGLLIQPEPPDKR
jgi:ABC-type amino acid transport substrate-binding protein